jgi:hexosaminidase
MKLFYCVLVFIGCLNAAYNIIPNPVKLTEKDGNFTIDEKTKILLPKITEEFVNAASVLVEVIKDSTGINLTVQENDDTEDNVIVCKISSAISNKEGYTLSVKNNKIEISAKQAVGIFYAFQTIRQLLPTDVEKKSVVPGLALTVPCCEIEDEPRFVYRGFMLDVCRHFSPYESVKRYLDLLTLHKFNNFHFHLTEGMGLSNTLFTFI